METFLWIHVAGPYEDIATLREGGYDKVEQFSLRVFGY